MKVMVEDLPESWIEHVLNQGYAGVDIETTGLHWQTDQVRTVQIESAGRVCVIRIKEGSAPRWLQYLMEEPRIEKIFHHATFDLRFLVHAWNIVPEHVSCTKIAAKIIQPGLPEGSYSLAALLRKNLDIELDKSLQLSDWSKELTPEQIHYAGNDVRYLRELLSRLRKFATQASVLDRVEASFKYLPTRVKLDLDGVGDVFTY